MTEQPDALLLAEKLEQQFPVGTAHRYLDGEAAAELRRLHSVNEKLLEAVCALRCCVKDFTAVAEIADAAIDAAKEMK